MSQINPSGILSGGARSPSLDYMLRDQALMSAAKNYFAWQARLVLPYVGRRVLEIGCGTGNFTGHLLDREFVIAVDREPEMPARVAARFRDRRNLRTVQADAADAEAIAGLREFEPDSCVCLNVLEHVADDAGALAAIARAIRPGGPIVLLVPAFPALYGPIDRNLGHFRRYTPRSLATVVAQAGLEIRRIRYVNAPGFFGWWLNARVWKRQVQSARQIALFDRYVVPVAEAVERVVRMPLGQSLLAVLAGTQPVPR